MFVSITRLRVRGWRFMPVFFVHALRSRRQTQSSPGFHGGTFATQPGRVFWTITVWDNDAAMRAFRNSGDHARSMKRLLHWCDEASYVHWSQEDATLPTASTVFVRLRDEGKLSKVNHPSAAHAAGEKAGKQEPKMQGPFSPVPGKGAT